MMMILMAVQYQSMRFTISPADLLKSAGELIINQ